MICGVPDRLSTDPPNAAELLHWWHRYQAQSLNEISDCIRNGLLQDLFTVRRQMELSCSMPMDNGEACCSQHLAELDSLYTRLEHLSSSLYSPYLEASLPLALQHALQPWQSELPLETHFSFVWDVEPIEQTRLFIGLTKRLLKQLTNTSTRPRCCDITLTQQNQRKELRYDITYAANPSLALSQELSTLLAPFLATFQIFTGGEYEQLSQSKTLCWLLSWSNPASSQENIGN